MNIEQEKMIVEALPSLYPLKDYEEDAINTVLEALPHWIPVTEEPIPDGEYLVTWTSEIQEKPILSIICRYSGVWDCWELQMLGHQDINVLAYMPLPEPYKGVTE